MMSGKRANFIFGKDSKKGFTLIELMVTMVVFVFVIAAVSNVFTGLLTQFKQQSKISETNIEKAIGLEILRQDLEGAGYGLPWDVANGWAVLAGYNEANPTGGTAMLDPPNAAIFNDGSPVIAPVVIGAPRAVVGGENNGFRGSDHLVIKSIIVSETNASQRWTWVFSDGTTRAWDSDNLTGTDFIIALDTSTEGFKNLALTAGNAFSAQFNNVGTLAPNETGKANIVYGIRPGANAPRIPFNRADYYIENPNILPLRCATSNLPLANRMTGVLMKGILTNTVVGGAIDTLQPLIDCVADMQVVFGLDMNDDGTVGTYSNADGTSINSSEGGVNVPATLQSATLLRTRLKEVRVYVLAHEGQMDVTYNFLGPNAGIPNIVPVGEVRIGAATVLLGRNYDLTPIPNWRNYRWKVYTLAVNPKNMGVQ